jgi:hypothetical protein
MTRRRAFLILVAVAAIALGWYLYGNGVTPAGQPPLLSLTPENFHELRSRFNAGAGATRLIVLLSPT